MKNLMSSQRKKLDLTQEDIDQYTGKKRNTVSLYESGKLNPFVDIAIKIKEILKAQDDKIFCDEISF